MKLEDELSKEGITVVKYSAIWCGPCKMMTPIMDRVATENPAVKVVHVDIDQEMELTAAEGIMSVPTLVFYKNGVLVKKHSGVMPEAELRKTLETL
jgi:thioredoxin 1